MFSIERYVDSEIIDGELVSEVWLLASTHTLEADRDLQLDRFLSVGMSPESLRIL